VDGENWFPGVFNGKRVQAAVPPEGELNLLVRDGDVGRQFRQGGFLFVLFLGGCRLVGLLGLLLDHELRAIANQRINEPAVDDVGPLPQALFPLELLLQGLVFVLEFLVQFLLGAFGVVLEHKTFKVSGGTVLGPWTSLVPSVPAARSAGPPR